MPDGERGRHPDDTARLEGFIKEQISELKAEFKEDITDVETQMAVIEGDVRAVRNTVSELQADVKSTHKLDINLARMDERVKALEAEEKRGKKNEDNIRNLWVSNILQFVFTVIGLIIVYFVTRNSVK